MVDKQLKMLRMKGSEMRRSSLSPFASLSFSLLSPLDISHKLKLQVGSFPRFPSSFTISTSTSSSHIYISSLFLYFLCSAPPSLHFSSQPYTYTFYTEKYIYRPESSIFRYHTSLLSLSKKNNKKRNKI
ncbi:GSCOCG00002843001-RA-CDS [Cotesia congregata]|nr:GSCOCG00002843001-RA-CDS [Cotesia congregata]